MMMRHVTHLEGIDALTLLTIRDNARHLPMINAQIDLQINGRSHEFSGETCGMSELVANGWHLMTSQRTARDRNFSQCTVVFYNTGRQCKGLTPSSIYIYTRDMRGAPQ